MGEEITQDTTLIALLVVTGIVLFALVVVEVTRIMRGSSGRSPSFECPHGVSLKSLYPCALCDAKEAERKRLVGQARKRIRGEDQPW